jgi:hypothetical protein
MKLPINFRLVTITYPLSSLGLYIPWYVYYWDVALKNNIIVEHFFVDNVDVYKHSHNTNTS